MPFIYKITNLINGKSYIGKTEFLISERWKQHIKDSRKTLCKDRPLYRAINKYGIENFSVECLENVSENNLSNREIYWIEKFNTYGNGYNATRGGEGKLKINHDDIVKAYLDLQNCAKVAREFNISPCVVRKILSSKSIPIKKRTYVVMSDYGHKIEMTSDDGKKIKDFSSKGEAANYLISTGITNALLHTVKYHISEVCNGKRKRAYGFKWKYKT